MNSEGAVVNPIVLFQITDHYRSNGSSRLKPATGMLLGKVVDGRTIITDSFQFPFEIVAKNSIYFDHSYVEEMIHMAQKINSRQQLLGWYNTLSEIGKTEASVHTIVEDYLETPIFLTFDISNEGDMPVMRGFVRNTSNQRYSEQPLTFKTVNLSIEAERPEEIAVDHMLRHAGIRISEYSTLTQTGNNLIDNVHTLVQRFRTIASYIESLIDDTMPANIKIQHNLQEIVYLLAKLNNTCTKQDFLFYSNVSLIQTSTATLVRFMLELNSLLDQRTASSKANDMSDDNKVKI